MPKERERRRKREDGTWSMLGTAFFGKSCVTEWCNFQFLARVLRLQHARFVGWIVKSASETNRTLARNVNVSISLLNCFPRVHRRLAQTTAVAVAPTAYCRIGVARHCARVLQPGQERAAGSLSFGLRAWSKASQLAQV